MDDLNKVLIINGFIEIPTAKDNSDTSIPYVGTIVRNMNYYGYTPSKETLNTLLSLDKNQLEIFWNKIDPVFENITGADLNMGDFIIYKNFPKEVLDMSEAKHCINQILIYLGCPSEYLTEEKKIRPPLNQDIDFKVLSMSDKDTVHKILLNLEEKNTNWNNVDKETMLTLIKDCSFSVDISDFKFKENGVFLAKIAMEKGLNISARNATDVLRLAVEEGSTLRGNVRFSNMKRSERRFFLNLLEHSKNLKEDVAMKKKVWKKFLRLLNPSDYKFQRVIDVYNDLYNNNLASFESKFKKSMDLNHEEAIQLAKSRIGFFINNIHHMYSVIGYSVLDSFLEVANKATIIQLSKLHKYMSTVNERKNFLVAPNGSWQKLQVLENKKTKIEDEDLEKFLSGLSIVINNKLQEKFPNGIILDSKTDQIKMPTNDLELDLYGRGTSFDIPSNIHTIRTASYWSIESDSNIWFDNGFNFINDEFQGLGSCCWNSQSFSDKAAYFSGDPVNISDLKGRACQMLDLDIDKLLQSGVRYASWNVLSYNNIPFKDANELVLSMQFCYNPLEGSVYEPSRSSLLFKVNGNNRVKHIAVIDLFERKVIFLDLNIKGSTQSSTENITSISILLPKFLEHLDCSLSVYDVFSHHVNKFDEYPAFVGKNENLDVSLLPVFLGYTDKNFNIPSKARAFVMNKENENNSFEKIDLLSI